METVTKGLEGLGMGNKREARENDDEITERIVIQTHSTAAMEELTKGLGFRRAYCPHILRLRLMAYGCVFPGLVSFFMNLLKGDPFFQEDQGGGEPPWLRAFRAGARQRVVRHQVVLMPDSKLKGRTFAEAGRYLHRWFGIVLVGVEVNGVFLLNPHHYFRFHPQRASSVQAFFIASGQQEVREALEALEHTHWDRMNLDMSLAEPPRVVLQASDLPPPRTVLLEKLQQRVDTRGHRKSFSVGCLRTMRPPTASPPPPPPGAPKMQVGSVSADAAVTRPTAVVGVGEGGRGVSLNVNVNVGVGQGESLQPSPRQELLQAELRGNHHEMLAKAHNLLREAHEAHRDHTIALLQGKRERQEARRHQAHHAQPRVMPWWGGDEEEEDDCVGGEGIGLSIDGSGGGGRVNGGLGGGRTTTTGGGGAGDMPRTSSADSGGSGTGGGKRGLLPQQTAPVFVDKVVTQVKAARDVLTQLLDQHYSPLPKEGLHDHVVLGLCNEAAPCPDAFIQFVTAFRKLVHLPMVVLCADSEKFATLLQGVRSRLRQSSRRVRDLVPPDTRDIFFVKGSPKNKADLHHCCVETAYAVVLLGDDVPRKREGTPDLDPVLMDRHVLLSCFKLEGILRQRLYSQVLTLVDLRNEVNMDLLRQRVRPPSQQLPSTITTFLNTPTWQRTASLSGREALYAQQNAQTVPKGGNPPTREVLLSYMQQNSCTVPKGAVSIPLDLQQQQTVKKSTLSSFFLQRSAMDPSSSAANHKAQDIEEAGRHAEEEAHPHNDPHSHIAGADDTFSPPRRPRLPQRPPAERASRPEQGCPLFAAGRVCCRSFFDVLFLYLYKNPYGLKFWKELIRSRMDDLAAEEFQMGTTHLNVEDEEEVSVGGSGGEGGPEEEVPLGYNGCELFMDTTGREEAPSHLEDLQDAIDALRSSLDEMVLPSAYIGLRYGELVDALLHIGIVPMGLYRPRGLMEAPMPFSVVNPPADTRLVRADLIFVLRPGPAFESAARGDSGGGGGPASTRPQEQQQQQPHQRRSYSGVPPPPVPSRRRPAR